jgi:hypothetical protein
VERPALEGATIATLKSASPELQAQVKELLQGSTLPTEQPMDKSVTTGEPVGGRSEKQMDENQKQAAAAAAAELEATKAQLALAKALGALNDNEKAHYATLGDEDKSAFLAKTPDARAQILKSAQEADAVVYTSDRGETFRKSDDPRLVRMAKQADEDARLLKAERDARELDKLEKRAEAELSHLPGEASVKVALLKAVGAMPSATRTGIEALLRAADAALAKGFDKFGVDGDKSTDTESDFDAMTKAYAEKHKVSMTAAINAVLDTPEGQQLAYDERNTRRGS